MAAEALCHELLNWNLSLLPLFPMLVLMQLLEHWRLWSFLWGNFLRSY